MDILVHSSLSAHKFGGKMEDYYALHKFIDSSKLFFFNAKHRCVFHHTFGIELCIQIFGDTIKNSNGDLKMVRDIAAEHIKEDLSGKVPTLKEWFEQQPVLFDPSECVASIQDEGLKAFILRPYLNSGIKSTFLITFSDLGVELVERVLGLEKAIVLREHLAQEHTLNDILSKFRFTSRWQYTPDMKQLERLKKNS